MTPYKVQIDGTEGRLGKDPQKKERNTSRDCAIYFSLRLYKLDVAPSITWFTFPYSTVIPLSGVASLVLAWCHYEDVFVPWSRADINGMLHVRWGNTDMFTICNHPGILQMWIWTIPKRNMIYDLRIWVWTYSLCFRLASFHFRTQCFLFLEKFPADPRIELPQTKGPMGRCGLCQGLVFTKKISATST